MADARDPVLNAQVVDSEATQGKKHCRYFEQTSNKTASLLDIHALLLDSLEISEAFYGSGPCLPGRHSVLSILALQHLDVKPQLLFNVERGFLAVKQSEEVESIDSHR